MPAVQACAVDGIKRTADSKILSEYLRDFICQVAANKHRRQAHGSMPRRSGGVLQTHRMPSAVSSVAPSYVALQERARIIAVLTEQRHRERMIDDNCAVRACPRLRRRGLGRVT